MASHKNRARSFVFNPFEISFVGYSNSGKTTLIEKLMPHVSNNSVYIKHDAHSFNMDREGKDTDRIKKSGARAIHIANNESFAFLGDGGLEKWDMDRFLAYDCALVEGYKKEAMAKILVLDENAEILHHDEILANPPIAVVSRFTEVKIPWDLPRFHSDDIESISQCIKDYFATKVPPIKALVLSGGKSQRMGHDKAHLVYEGQNQLGRVTNLAKKFASEVYVSCRQDQIEDGRGDYQLVFDKFIGFGPLSGILSAMESDRSSAWLVLGIDLPFLEAQTLDQLLKSRNPQKFATSFKAFEDFPEPLVSIYEPKAFSRLLSGLGLGYDCPRKMLINSPIALLDPLSPKWLENINDPKAYEEALRDLS